MATAEEQKFNDLWTRIQKLTEERARRLGELDALKARLQNDFKCSTLDEARALHKTLQEQLKTEGDEVATMLANLEQQVAAIEAKVRG